VVWLNPNNKEKGGRRGEGSDSGSVGEQKEEQQPEEEKERILKELPGKAP